MPVSSSRLLHQLRRQRPPRRHSDAIPTRASNPSHPMRSGIHRLLLPHRHTPLARLRRPHRRSHASIGQAPWSWSRSGILLLQRRRRVARSPTRIRRDSEPVPGQGTTAQGLILLGHRKGHREQSFLSGTVLPRGYHADYCSVVRWQWYHLLYPAGAYWRVGRLP